MLPSPVQSGFRLLGILYFFLEARLPAHCLSSAHFSEISCLWCARDLRSDIVRASARSQYPNHSTPRVSGSYTANAAHSSTSSFPGTSLWAGPAGTYLISMVTSGLAMCSFTWSGQPGCSEVARLMAACASVKIVTHSDVVSRLTAVSSALARAAHAPSWAPWL